MLFNSAQFALFLPVVFILYWFVTKSLRSQNILLLVASYFFYCCWDWRFLFLLAFSTFLDYFTGLKIHQSPSRRNKKIWLAISVGINLGFLGFFKYYNFFVSSFADLLQSSGFRPNITTLNIILPVGISFYTFHGLSYVFDIYNNKVKPTTNWVDYSLFVSFFPLLVAGPIERAHHLLPQVKRPRIFSGALAADGLRQILWGLFKKVVVADSCAEYADMIFNNPGGYSGSMHLLGAVYFSFQIYGDFSGYSDIAIGTAKLLGFDLLRNFAYPYFSRDIAEFWKRWHISLSSWFRDYLYIPLGGSRGSKWQTVRNVLIIFVVSGFWHGANWTFIFWGAYHGLLFLPLLLMGSNKKHTDQVAEGKSLPSLKEALQMLLTFLLVMIGWVFFRAKSLDQAIVFLRGMGDRSLFAAPLWDRTILPLLLIGLLLIIEWVHRDREHGLQFKYIRSPYLRWSVYILFTLFFLAYYTQARTFIYFQF